MKLETKLGISTGGLIVAMLLSALMAHLRIQRANRLTNQLGSGRMPLYLDIRDVRSHLARSLHSLESDMLFGRHGNASTDFKAERAYEIDEARKSIAAAMSPAYEVDLGADRKRLRQVRDGLESLKLLQERIEQLDETGSPADQAQAYLLLQNETRALDDSINTVLVSVSDSQAIVTRDEFRQIDRADHQAVLSL